MFKTIFVFLIEVLLNNKDEVNIRSAKFNPYKLISIVFFAASVGLNILLIIKLERSFDVIDGMCPQFKVLMQNNLKKALEH